MSTNDNLKEFVTMIADAIRNKKGTTELINPQDFGTEIESIQGTEVIESGYNVEQVILEDGTCELHITDKDYVPLYTLTLEKTGEGKEWLTISNETSAQYTAGQEVVITATKDSMFGKMYNFNGWYEGDTLISSSSSFTYIMPNYNVTLTAKMSSSSSI